MFYMHVFLTLNGLHVVESQREMGKISPESQHKQTHVASHFSHPHHPFKLISHNQLSPNISSSSSCSGCKLKPSGIIYSCTICTYFLHKTCFEMPHKITHPFHKDHPFTLLPAPAYAEGLFNCDACRETGDGFSYHCKPCGIDLHILCAATPLSLSTPHHPHKLDLAFESPYGNKSFCCDICKAHGSNHWLYRCSLCEFDAHLKCARGAPPPPPQPPQPPAAAAYFRSVPMPQSYGRGGSHFMAAPPPPVQNNYMTYPVMNNAAVGVPAAAPAAFGLTRQNETVYQAMMQNIQNNKAMTEAMIARITGGGGGAFGGGFGGSGGGSVQQIMQMVSGLNSNGGGGGSGIPGLDAFGGGGSGIPGLDAFGGGGGGIPGLDALGGGGLESVQSLLGGVSSGGLDFIGGGGLDFVGGALGSLL